MTNKVQEKLNDYEGFVDKFKIKKTTDDCYTPQPVFDYILQYVQDYVEDLSSYRVHRPFKPGGDYKREAVMYNPAVDVVVDNPPFSILAQIVDFYLMRHIKFWLYAPSLTLFGYLSRPNITAYVADCDITYKNGAKVPTGFLTNMGDTRYIFRLAPELNAARDISKALRGEVPSTKQSINTTGTW